MLSDRRQRVLSALIEEYVANALPVGSRTLTERYQLGVSPATVRNDLSVLEEAGYIVQPHVSAGRVPTDFGYRAFVDNLLSAEPYCSGDARYRAVVEELRAHAAELDSLLEQTSVVLSRLTDCLSIVLSPMILHISIKQVSLISLSPSRVLLVVVTEDGKVLNRQIELGFELSTEMLGRIQTLLNQMLCGQSLADAQEGMNTVYAQPLQDPMVRIFFEETLACVESAHRSRSHQLGLGSLMNQPEFSEARSLIPVMQVLENETVLLHVLDEASREDGLSVHIGSENSAEGFSGVSVVASRYGLGNRAGVVAVIGPTRMDYSKVIQAVRAASSALDEI